MFEPDGAYFIAGAQLHVANTFNIGPCSAIVCLDSFRTRILRHPAPGYRAGDLSDTFDLTLRSKELYKVVYALFSE
jgi:hypothetical protein